MADECVVCGEAEEGKPLYKKLGSGEFNVEVITALKALQMVSIPEAAKNSSYICWDCDELIVEQYDRYLREQQAAAVVPKHTKKQSQPNKKKKKSKPSKLKLKISKDNKRDSSWGIAKPQPQKNIIKKPASDTNSATSSVDGGLSKTKRLEQRRAANAYHSSHCLMCDNNFETERRTYQRFSLKNRINDEMDIAQVMEILGLARHIAKDMKARRYVCNPCFFIIRRSYKDKLMKGASLETTPQTVPSTPTSIDPQRPIHRATTEEHAAEIAKLLPPGLAECYKIVTANPVHKKHEPVATPQKDVSDENSCQADGEEQVSDDGEEEDEEEGALKVSQDEHGNYYIDIHDRGCEEGSKVLAEQEEQPAVLPTSRRKKNVLLPRRMHKHLSLSPTQETPGRHSDTIDGEEKTDEKEEEEQKKTSSSSCTTQESRSGRKCNICGITIGGKPSTWWHTLTSPLDGFETVNVTTALKLLETCLAPRNQKVAEDQSVCLLCYTKVSTGFKSQVVQRIARHRNMNISEVNLSRVKVRMLPKEALEPPEVLGLQGRGIEAASTANVPMPSEGFMGTCATQPMSEESGDGEKENMDIEQHGHKRKLNEENVLSDKKRKLHRSGVDVPVMSSETEAKQDHSSPESLTVVRSQKGRGIHCMRAKNGRFAKKRTSILSTETASITEGLQQAGRNVVTGGQEEKAHTPQVSQETPKKQNKESKETEPLVVLKDLKFVLPQEAFSGKTVSSHKIESIMEPPTQLSSDQPVASHSDLSTTSSPLQLVFNARSTYHPPVGDTGQTTPTASISEHAAAPHVDGRCVVCGGSYTVPLSSWHSVEENIRPPTLLVPVRWVCISLAIPLPQVSVEDARLARVCKQCFERLGDHFEVFVKRKVGESCGLEAEAVDLSEYLFTFNTETMNLEADPKQQSYIHEFEDVGQLLQRIQVLVEQFSVDEVVGEGKRQPVSEQHFCVWLLLVLNELRMQVGAAIGDLAHWLVALMPVNMYESGQRPCPNNLASFLLNTTRCSKELTEDMLEGPIPAWVFVDNDTLEATEAGKAGTTQENDNEDEDLCWEDFLHYVNLDALVGGKATPVSAVHFTQGLVYAVWRASQSLGEGEQQVMDWLRQLSPLPLTKEQLGNLVTMIGQLHSHLEEHPEDIHELECSIIPQLQNEQCSTSSSSNTERAVRTPLSARARNSRVSEKDGSSARSYISYVPKEDRHSVQDYSSCDTKKDRSRLETKKSKNKSLSIKRTPTMKSRKESPMLKTPSHKKPKRSKSFESYTKAREQKSEHSKKASVSNSSQTLPSGPKTRPLYSSHSDNQTEYSDAPHVDSGTKLSLAKHKSRQDTSIAQTPSSPGKCEPHLTVMPQPDNTHTQDQSVGTTHTIIKETGITTQLCKDKVPTNGIAANTQLGAQTVATIEPSEDSVASSEPDEETVTTTESSEETVAAAESSEETETTTEVLEETATNAQTDEETASISETSEQTAASTEPDEETLPISGTSKMTVAISETSEETAATTEPDEEILPISGTSKKTVAISGTSEAAATTELGEEIVTTTEPPQESLPSSGTSVETSTSAKPAKKTLTIIGTSEKTASTQKLTEESVATTESADETAALSRTLEKVVATSGTSEKTAVHCRPSVETAVTCGTSEETTMTKEAFEKATTTYGSPAGPVIYTAEPAEEITPSIKPIEETGASSGTSENTAATVDHCEEVLMPSGTYRGTAASSEPCITSDTSEETEAASDYTKKTVVNADISEEIVGTTETCKESVVSPKPLLTSHGLCKGNKAICQLPRDTSLTTQDTAAVNESSGKGIFTDDDCESAVATSVHNKRTATTTTTHTTADGMNAVVTTSTASTQAASLSPIVTLATPDTRGTANNTQVTSTTQETLVTRNTICGKVKTEVSKQQVMPGAATHIKTLGSSTILVSPPNKLTSHNSRQQSVIKASLNETSSRKPFDISDSTRIHSTLQVSQNEMFSKKTSCQALDHESQATLERTNENGQNATNLQPSALRKIPETQTGCQQKRGHINVNQHSSSSGSEKTFTINSKHVGTNNMPTKVCIMTLSKEEDDTVHQTEKSVDQGKEKESLQRPHTNKADTPPKTIVVPGKNSKDIKLIPKKKMLSSGVVPVLVNSPKPSLHKSERVSIRVHSTAEKTVTHESQKADNSIGSKKGSVWLYQDPCKERARTEKRMDTKSSYPSSPVQLETHQEGREGNNNAENPSLRSVKVSSKGRLDGVGDVRDKLKHFSKSEICKMEDTNPCTDQQITEKLPTLDDKKHKNMYVERIPGSGDKIMSVGVKKGKNMFVENHRDKEKVELSESCVVEKNKVIKVYHKPVTPSKVEVVGKKKVCVKTPSKSLVLEENKLSKQGKLSSPVTRPNRTIVIKSSSHVSPSNQGPSCRTPKGPPEKKPKLTFEELMNYDAGIGHS